MKIFFLSYWFPYPPDNGSRIRVFNFLKALGARHEVHLLALLQADSDARYAEQLTPYCRIVALEPLPQPRRWLPRYVSLFTRRPHSVIASFDMKLYEKVQQAIQRIQPDILAVSMVDVAEYVTFGKSGLPSVLIDHNCEFGVIQRRARLSASLPARLRYEMTWRKYAAWEASILKQFSRAVMPTEEDRLKMQQYDPTVKNIVVIPNAADTDYYDPSQWAPEGPTLVYNGALTYGPNFDSVLFYKEQIYPALSQRYPGVRLLVTGRTTGVNLEAFRDCPGITFTGYVEDIRSVLYRSAACIIPLRQGGGMRLKIPEALAAGVPVVSTRMGAEGLACLHEQHLLLADTPEEFAAAIIRVLTDRPLVEHLRRNGRQLVEQQYSWKHSAGRFVDLIEALAAERKHANPSR